ncbi:MAG: APC family permease [Natrialbaceae archaeon]|nr:APC family permease [Natrialbaceae archaeon]
MTEPEFSIIDQKIGLIGATVLTIGNAVAITMFILPAALLAEGAGPSIALAAGATAIPTFFSVLLMLQLGGAIPTAGGSYVYVSRLIAPYWGFLTPWISVPAIWLGLVYTAAGFAEYTLFIVQLEQLLFPLDISLLGGFLTITWLEVLIWAGIIPFLFANLVGIRFVTQIQFVFVAVIIGGMLLFIIPGSFTIDPGNYTPMFPEGGGPFIRAAVALFIGMYGFGLALNIGEEIKDPVKNIPRVIFLSTIIGVFLMVATVVVAVGALHWEEWAGAQAGISIVAETFLPSWGAGLVAVAAIVGALTTINTIYVNFSRLIMRAARDEMIPIEFAKINDRFGSPNRAVLLLGIPSILLVPFAPGVDVMAIVLSLALLFTIILLAIAAYRLPKVFPARYENSFYRLPKPFLYFCCVGGLVVPLVFWVLLMTQEPLDRWRAAGVDHHRLSRLSVPREALCRPRNRPPEADEVPPRARDGGGGPGGGLTGLQFANQAGLRENQLLVFFDVGLAAFIAHVLEDTRLSGRSLLIAHASTSSRAVPSSRSSVVSSMGSSHRSGISGAPNLAPAIAPAIAAIVSVSPRG